MINDDQAITDYAAGIFLRYFRSGILAGAKSPHVERTRDLHLLRAHWAISKPVREFVSYVLSHRHETQGLLEYRKRQDDAVLRGRIDTRSTMLARALSGHPSLIVSEEPTRSLNTGPNQLLAWVVHQASMQANRLLRLLNSESTYRPTVESVVGELNSVRRIDALREPLRYVSSVRRPSSGAILIASRSRRMIYRYAVNAYETLLGVEKADPDALSIVLRSTLIAPLEQWRRFELAVAAAIGEALSEESGAPLQLSLIDESPDLPIIRCGRYSIYWQRRQHYRSPPLEPSEERLERSLSAYGMRLGEDRPDLLVVDACIGSVVAIVEVKYVAGDTAKSRMREAISQIVQYARGYATEDGIDSLISRSLVALSVNALPKTDRLPPAPTATDFPAICSGALKTWIREWVNEPKEGPYGLLVPPSSTSGTSVSSTEREHGAVT